MPKPLFSHLFYLREPSQLWTVTIGSGVLTPLDSRSIVLIPASTGTGIVVGSRTIKSRFAANTGSDVCYYTLNAALSGGSFVQDDATKASWFVSPDCFLDALRINRMPPAGAVANLLTVDNAGNLTISGNNATKATGTTWINPSDRRLKDQVTDYATGLAAIVALAPRTYLFNGKAGIKAGLRGYGFMADEVVAVMPEMIRTMRAKLDADDETDTDIEVLDTSNLVLALVNAVKELAARVAKLEKPGPPAP